MRALARPGQRTLWQILAASCLSCFHCCEEEPKRSRRFFALIYDFLVFTDSVFKEVEEREEKVGALAEQRDKMRAKLHKMKQQIHERRMENEKNQLAKEEDMRRVEAKTEELQRCQEEKLALKAQLDALGLSLAKLDIAIKDTELRTMEAGSEKQRLEGLVIQASEEQEIKKRDEKLAVLKEDNQKKKDHLAQLQQRASFINTTKEKLDKLIAMLQEIQQEKSKEKDIQAAIQKRVSQVTELQEEIKDQEQSNLQLTQQLTASETKLQHIHQAWDLKQDSLNKEIKEQKQVLEDLERNQTEQDIVCKEVSDDVADLDGQIRQSMEEIRNTNIMIKNNYKLILDAMEEGNVELMSALTEATKCVEEFRSAE
ncbi:paramyosin-like isoform X1 [Eriocheir sinensis]|uniref:paramyosin-like isoform X1 n=1 Tax=Eriocheir sinensis TaxID=95602 RepID=UPI0021C6449F|nr:paramyosin-like isoform X1 [Eriocheir sinensis]XP_050700320.1 paramyosin-like isoform X1 [Eriocheir sinensis]